MEKKHINASPIPSNLKLYIGGFLGPSFSVELQEGDLIYISLDRGREKSQEVRITPTIPQWQMFQNTLNDIGVWRWKNQYMHTNATDGTQWRIQIEYPDQKLYTNGHNQYPQKSGAPNQDGQVTKTFEKYTEAVELLLGGKLFR